MPCPFLREAHVRSCGAWTFRKLLLDTRPAGAATELCSSGAYPSCPLFQEHAESREAAGSRCPLLQQGLAHYCAAAPVTKLIPYSERGGRCAGDGFRFCELYLALARPAVEPCRQATPHVDSIAVPTDVWFAPNHMWLHVSEAGECHIGVDAFFAAVIGSVDSLNYVTGSGAQRPAAVLSVRGTDWPVTFPNAVLISGTNAYLRHVPERLTADPYGAAWLFEGSLVEGSRPASTAGLVRGEAALAWMRSEVARLNETVHRLSTAHAVESKPLLNDGGCFAPGFARELPRENLLCLFHDFFAPHTVWER